MTEATTMVQLKEARQRAAERLAELRDTMDRLMLPNAMSLHEKTALRHELEASDESDLRHKLRYEVLRWEGRLQRADEMIARETEE